MDTKQLLIDRIIFYIQNDYDNNKEYNLYLIKDLLGYLEYDELEKIFKEYD